MAVARPPRWLRALVLLTLLAGVTALTLFAVERTYLATFLVNVLFVGALATVASLLSTYGLRPWTVFTAGITLLGALVQVGVTLVGLSSVGALVPALAWGLGLLGMLYAFSTSDREDSANT